MLRRAVGGSALVVILLGMTVGCSVPTPLVATPTPTAEPLFADDASALAAAATVYDDYLAVRNVVENEGGAGVDRLAPLTSPAVLDAETRDVESFFLPLGARSTGEVTTDSMTLIRLDDRPRADGAVMVVSLCEDSSARTLTLADGRLATKRGMTRVAYRVTIGVDPAAEQREDSGSVSRVLARDVVDDPAVCGEVAPGG